MLLSSPTATLAQGEPEEVLLNDESFGKGDAQSPVLLALPDGNIFACWIDSRRGHRDVIAAVVTRDGDQVSAPRIVNDDDILAQQRFPLLAATPDASLIWIAWIDERGGANLYLQRAFPNGALLGDNIPVKEPEVGSDPATPSLAVDPDGTALIVWQDRHGLTGENVLYGRRIGSDGLPLGDGISELVPSETGGVRSRPYAAPHPGGGWALVWQETEPQNENVRLTTLDEKLAVKGLIWPVGDAGNSRQSEPQIHALADSTFLVLWKDISASVAETTFGFRSPDGAQMGVDHAVQDVGDDTEEQTPLAAVQTDGSFAVGWLSHDDGDWLPTVRLLRPDGTPEGDVFHVDAPGGIVARDLTMAPMTGGDYACAWIDQRATASLIYMKVVSPPQSVPDLPTPLAHLEPGAPQVFPDVALHDDGSGMIVWVDQRTHNPNLFGQILDRDGRPQGPNKLISERPLGRFGDPLDLTDVLVSTPRVSTAAGNYLVTWVHGTEAGRGLVYGQLFDPSGEFLGNNFLAAPSREGTPQATPNALVDQRTKLMAILWEDNTVDAGGDIFIQKFDSTGVPVDEIFHIVDDERRSAAQVYPAADISEFGQIIVAWTDRRNGGPDIYAQEFHVQEIGPQWTPDNFLVAGEELGVNYSQTHPDVAFGPNSYVIVWDDDGGGVTSVWGRFTGLPSLGAGASAARADTVLQISLPPQGDSPHWPRVSMTASGGFVVTWWDNYQGEAKVLARLYDVEVVQGVPRPFALSEPFLVTPVRDEASRFSPAVDARGDVIQFAFADSRRWLGWDVYARREDWTFRGDSIPDTSAVPVVLSDAAVIPVADGLLVAWTSPRDLSPSAFSITRRGPLADPSDPLSGPRSIFRDVQWIDPVRSRAGRLDREIVRGASYAYWVHFEGGTLAGPLLAAFDPSSEVVFSAYPNPFTNEITLRLPPADRERVLEIFDVQGRRVWRRQWPAGDPAAVTWDGRDRRGRPLAQGLYWARLTPRTDPRSLRIMLLNQ
jgi:hypothetical protein